MQLPVCGLKISTLLLRLPSASRQVPAGSTVIMCLMLQQDLEATGKVGSVEMEERRYVCSTWTVSV